MAGHGKCGGFVCRRFFWKIIRVLPHHFVLTVVAGDFNTKILVDIKRQRLVRKVLQRIHQDLCRNTNAATVLGFNIKMDFHHRFQVGSNNRQFVGFNLKKEIFQDRQNIV